MKKRKRVQKGRGKAVILLCLLLAVAGCTKQEGGAPTPEPTKEATPEPTKEATPEPTKEATPEPTKEVTPEPTKEAKPETTKTPTQEPTKEATPEPTKAAAVDAWFDFGKGNNMENVEIETFCPSAYQTNRIDVMYGKLVRTSYYSTTCEKNRNVIILLPQGYTEDKEYPVLYVLHGIFGDEKSMIGDGNSGLRITVGNMMAEGIARDMIFVFPYMYASKTQDVCTAIDADNIAAYDNFINDLTNDLMPFLKENYSVAEGRENTAIIGFSMGGRESLAIGFLRPDLFGYVGAIAPAPGLTPGRDWATTHPGQFAEDALKFAEDVESPYVLMLCCGDKDSVVGTFPQSYHTILSRNEVNHLWWIVPGSDHGDPAITSGIYNFCKAIFKAE